ncbi:hypothetical protein EDC04DRAFT_2716308 [Pisolithus marmoratus]|nr:hypothetical protein EDC04DRAFT_2716308 [Pisolithus marmoratus]
MDVPDCVVRARNYLLHITQKYCKIIRPRLDRLSIVAWCTTGRKKWPNILGAKEAPVTILCLGADVFLHLTPRGGYHNSFPDAFVDPSGELGPEGERGLGQTCVQEETVTRGSALPKERVDQDSQKRSASAISAETVDGVGGRGDTAGSQSGRAAVETGDKLGPDSSLTIIMESAESVSTAPIRPKEKGKAKQRKGKKAGRSVPPFSIVLMHGDSVTLTGDDYECTVERKGTTMRELPVGR